MTRPGLESRLALLGRFRERLTQQRDSVLDHLQALRPGSSRAELISSELIPLLDNCRFLERHSKRILAPRKLGRWGQPAWLWGVDSVVHREPLGRVLMVAPSNYPLFLPLVSCLSAWAAGNQVWLKSAPGSLALHQRVLELFLSVGGPPQYLRLLGEAPEEVDRALAEGVQKLVLVGSATTGRTVLAKASAALVPTIAELSGWDSVFIHPQADLELAARAIAWGLALNGGRTCVAPRRIFLSGSPERFEEALGRALQVRATVPLSDSEKEIITNHSGPILQRVEGLGPAVLSRLGDGHSLLKEPVFGALAGLQVVESDEQALESARRCPYALGAALFGPEDWCRQMAHRVPAQVVSLNDLLVPSADPRVPFGGSGGSGWGRIRGQEGLLEMTQTRTVCQRRGGSMDHLLDPSPHDDAILEEFLLISHGKNAGQRMGALWRLIATIAKERIRRRRARP